MTEDLRNEAHVALQDKTPLMRLNIGKKIKIGNKIRSRVFCDSSRTYRILGIFQRRWRREDGRRAEEEAEEISSHGWRERTSLRGSIPAFPPQAEAGLAPAGGASGCHLRGHDLETTTTTLFP